MHVEDPCLVEEEFPNPVIALLTAFRHYNRNNRQTFSARRRNIAFTRIWYYYIVEKSNSYIHERIILIKRTIEKIWREKSLPSKWNCLRSGFLARGGAGQLKLHSGTQLKRERSFVPLSFKSTCKEKILSPDRFSKVEFFSSDAWEKHTAAPPLWLWGQVSAKDRSWRRHSGPGRNIPINDRLLCPVLQAATRWCLKKTEELRLFFSPWHVL